MREISFGWLAVCSFLAGARVMFRRFGWRRAGYFAGLVLVLGGLVTPCLAAREVRLAATPPMGWNDWAHYQCNYTDQTILKNARALVTTGLAARGYDTVTIDDCWMQKGRGRDGNLQPDVKRFPHGMKAVADAVHAMGLKFGIYEDAGYATCGGFAGSGAPKGGGATHFSQDARLFASWGVDYLKLDGCNVSVAKGESRNEAYRKAYAAEQAALESAGRPVVFSESAPAYFQGSPEWYDVLGWVRHYGQLWREGSDIATYNAENPDAPRFHSVMWNYAYNLPLGRFQSSGNWNDADFIIGGDRGMTLAETRSQVALWSMMSAPLILSSDLAKLSPTAIAVLGNRAMLEVDQDPLGRMATLVRRTPAMDLLLKPLAGGSYAVAVLNRSAGPLQVAIRPAGLGFMGKGCRLEARNLWTGGVKKEASGLDAKVASHDTVIWKVRPAAACGAPVRMGAIVRIVPGAKRNAESYTRCLSSAGAVETCTGLPEENWSVAANGSLRSGGKCLTAEGAKVGMKACSGAASQRWTYTLEGNLLNRSEPLCLTGATAQGLAMRACGHNRASQVWSLPNAIAHK